MKRVLIMICLFASAAGCAANDWRTASREPAGIAKIVPELGLDLPYSAIGSGYEN